MYLKSLEIQGFKSFANKTVLEFHNGITGIVGPNGSGKSNIADAVRWVLGEQSAKQLRGASMQDVIFAGTENRKPLSYAYVAITLDNSDHQLATSYDEVTVARRVYRSGESEYLLNGTVCRLKEVTELFYDTGIGKEGYSIIGQGQIDRILSGKPEERRELFDEAAGIVKFKKRKTIAQKKLDNERENLVRITDILTELERQVGPLERQAEKARTYLRKRESLKELDVNMFVLESERLQGEEEKAENAWKIADEQMTRAQSAYEQVRQEYEGLGEKLAGLDGQIEELRQQITDSTARKQDLESQIRVLEEQIRTSEVMTEHFTARVSAIDADLQERASSKEEYLAQTSDISGQIEEISRREETAQHRLEEAQARSAATEQQIEQIRQEQVHLLEGKASIKGRQQRLDTMLEQLNIRKAELNKQILEGKTAHSDDASAVEKAQTTLDDVEDTIRDHKEKEYSLEQKDFQWREKLRENRKRIEESQNQYMRQSSRLESLRNIAERYDGYGQSIRRVMEQRSSYPGLIGVVSDLIQVEKRYEVAVETALGGQIQNVVTEDEATAKQMIAFLKQNRYGRATFLPLPSLRARTNQKADAVCRENGIIGVASDLVSFDEKYRTLAVYLLGRFFVADTIEHALAIARKYNYSLNIVTLEGESLNPGGSLSGGAFKNNSNLLGRNREIEELEKQTQELKKAITQLKSRREDLQTAQALNEDELTELRETLQTLYIEQNTAQLSLEQAEKDQKQRGEAMEQIRQDMQDVERQAAEIRQQRQEITEESDTSNSRKEELQTEMEELQTLLEEQKSEETTLSEALQQLRLKVTDLHLNLQFAGANADRIDAEVSRLTEEKERIHTNLIRSAEEIGQKKLQISTTREEISGILGQENQSSLAMADLQQQRETANSSYRTLFDRQENISEQKAALDKEIYRLTLQKEKLQESIERLNNYMWEEYELTPHAAAVLRDEVYDDLSDLKKRIGAVKDEIKKLGDVNVNAIDEYREISERYTFLKTQHDDLIEAEKTLVGIIEELDKGMRRQFNEKFAEIQKEFDHTFKLLFGGGHGTLELVEGEDVLEAGIRIIAQPPGKKLQNMMQLSGGEKALSAIALLFAIQALKPSPFCLLDEIEAALDDSNVVRYANYLNKLTEHTQFIVITHRRGTMNAADRLYGITMQEKGVSVLVSVSLVEESLT